MGACVQQAHILVVSRLPFEGTAVFLTEMPEGESVLPVSFSLPSRPSRVENAKISPDASFRGPGGI